jgi:transposase
MWCVPELDDEYVERMEDILDLLEKPMDSREPVVALDERPVLLRTDVRRLRQCAPSKVSRRDSEYVRHGVANVFAIVTPHEGRHLTHATRNRKGPAFARALERVAAAYCDASTIHLIMDNLSSHRMKSVCDALGAARGSALWSRFSVHYTPKHGSWLNPAEIEISLWSRECQGRDRVGTLLELRRRTACWNRRVNRERRRIRWRFRSKDAREKFGYCRQSIMNLSAH